MRIAFVNHSRGKVGGAEVYLDTVIPAFARAGHSVAALHEKDTPPDREAIRIPPGAPVWSITELGSARALSELRSWRPDVCFTHGITDPDLEASIVAFGGSALYLHNYYGTCISGDKLHSTSTPTVCERRFGPACLLHYFPSHCGGRTPLTMWKRYKLQSRRLALMRRYTALVTNSEHMSREMARHGLTAQCVHCPVTGTAPAPSAQPPFDGVLRLVCAGRMSSLKGGRLLIDALPEIQSRLDKKLHVTFAGDGPDRAAWEQSSKAIRSSEITVEFVGWLATSALHEVLQTAHLLVYPSIWPEPFGLSGLEAGLFGVPSVAFAVGGIPEWLHDGVNGHLASPGDRASLAEAIVRSLADPQHYSQLRQGALQRTKAFGVDTHVEQLLRIFERCAG